MSLGGCNSALHLFKRAFLNMIILVYVEVKMREKRGEEK